MKLTVWSIPLGFIGLEPRRSLPTRVEKEVDYRASEWYEIAGEPIEHVHNVILHLGHLEKEGIGYVDIEGTADEMEKLVEELQGAIQRNRTGKT
mgnify:FL=1